MSDFITHGDIGLDLVQGPLRRASEEKGVLTVEIVSLKMHCFIVAMSGDFMLGLEGGAVRGEISKSTWINKSFSNMSFQLKRGEVRMLSYIPMSRVEIVMSDSLTGGARFRLNNVLFHVDDSDDLRRGEPSSILAYIKSVRDGVCRFTYRNEFSTAVCQFDCLKFLKYSDGGEVLKSFGMLGLGITKAVRDNHGIRLAVEDAGLVSETFSNFTIGGNENVVMNSFEFRFDERERREFPFGVFSAVTSKDVMRGKPKVVQMLYTMGVDRRPFVCPVSGHSTFGIKIGTSVRRFKSFSKFVKTLGTWNKNCQALVSFKMWYCSDSPVVNVSFAYDVDLGDKGSITVSYLDVRKVLLQTYTTTIRHIVGVFGKKAALSDESNSQNRRDWDERFCCPHHELCPRNCAHYIPDVLGVELDGVLESWGGGLKRVPIPRSAMCMCSKYMSNGVPLVSKYHYNIELCLPVHMGLGGMMLELIRDYQRHPGMYAGSKLVVLLEKNSDMLYLIESFLY